MPSPKIESPGSATNTTRAKYETTIAAKITRVTSEILGMAIAALIFAASVWTSVFGMAGGFDQTSDVVLAAAGVDQHDQ